MHFAQNYVQLNNEAHTEHALYDRGKRVKGEPGCKVVTPNRLARTIATPIQIHTVFKACNVCMKQVAKASRRNKECTSNQDDMDGPMHNYISAGPPERLGKQSQQLQCGEK
eukprot:scaffold101906_cov20-Tisochrysis_lutea.AAC.4